MIKDLNNEKFEELVKNGKVIVDFYATWCGPCKMLSPVLEEIANSRSEITVVKVDVDKNNDLAKQFGIMSVPTVMFYNNGNLIEKKVGFMPKEVVDSIIKNM